MAVGPIPRLGGGHYRFSLALDTGGTNNTTANYRLLATATDNSLGYTLRAHDNCKTSLRYTSLPRRAAASLAAANAQNTENEVVRDGPFL